jgi:putative acetyltransferase
VTTPSSIRIETDDLSRPVIHALLEEHLRNMYELSPPESVHALDLDKLRHPDITFWSAWDGAELAGIGALKELEAKHGEIKSMRTPAVRRRRGAGRLILAHIIGVARARDYDRLSLETGSMKAFEPAQRLYASFGFAFCGPFEGYVEDPNSVFMTLRL